MATGTKKAKAAPKAKVAAKPVSAGMKFGNQRTNIRKKVVTLRDKKQQSWAVIGKQIEAAPNTVRRLYDEQKGSGTHYGLLPGKGGRKPVK